MKKIIPTWVAILIVFILAAALAGYIWIESFKIASSESDSHNAGYFPSQNIKSTETNVAEDPIDSNILDPFLAKLYVSIVHTKEGAIDCLLQSAFSGNQKYSATFCPVLQSLVSESKKDNGFIVGEEGARHLVRIDAITENPTPVIEYLYKNRNVVGQEKIYMAIYQDYVISKYQKDLGGDFSSERKAILKVGENKEYYRNPYYVNISKTSDDLDVIVLSDMEMSGAYNIYDTIYFGSFSSKGFVLEEPPVISEEGGKLVRNATSGMVNSGFDPEYGTLYERGFLPFGAYPCSEVSHYSIADHRLILISKDEPKDCVGKDYSSPESIPEDFDAEPQVETYKMKQDVWDRASEVSPLSLPLSKYSSDDFMQG